MSSSMEVRRELFMDDLSSNLIEVLRELHVEESKCGIAAAEVTAMVVAKYGGEQLYFPKDYTHKSQERALAIFEAFNGRNHTEVARQFDISVRSVYRICKRIHAQIIAKNQHDMFNSH